MPAAPSSILSNKALNGWGLFCVVVILMAAAIIAAMWVVGVNSPEGVSEMIQFSVRLAVP